MHARAVLLATGGLGGVFLNTTNPDVATGDGVAMAYRAGAEIGDIEFVQFHPTALHVEGAPRFLLSEALRGEGAHLRNAAGERFMERYHPLKELAPRDVVARAIVAEMTRTGAPHVLLDLTHREPGFVRARFPRIYQTCLRYGVDLERQAGSGGARRALRHGRRAHRSGWAHQPAASVRRRRSGLYRRPRRQSAGQQFAAGGRGVRRAGGAGNDGSVAAMHAGFHLPFLANRDPRSGAETFGPIDVRTLAWRTCGIVRDAAGLTEACRRLQTGAPTPEAQNLHAVALLIARCALAREESRGAHFRTDYPEKRPAFERHSIVKRDAAVAFR